MATTARSLAFDETAQNGAPSYWAQVCQGVFQCFVFIFIVCCGPVRRFGRAREGRGYRRPAEPSEALQADEWMRKKILLEVAETTNMACVVMNPF